MVAQEGWVDGQSKLMPRSEKMHGIPGHWRIERSAARFEVWNQLAQRARIEHRAGKAVRPDLACLFQNIDIFQAEWSSRRLAFFTVSFDELGKSKRAAEARRACSHDQNIGLESLSLRVDHW